MSMKVFWSGFPGPCGGANTECWHTAKMLRGGGVDVTFVPTHGADLSGKSRLESIGCEVIEPIPKRQDLANVPGLKGSVVVSMCNSHFIRAAAEFRNLGCRIVWVNCMTFVNNDETMHYTNYPKGVFDAYVFQSEFQRKRVEPKLKQYGYKPERGHLIRGAFDVNEFPFKPRPRGDGPFAIGRLARGNGDKWSSNWWSILQHAERPLEARCMAWSKQVQKKCGSPPDAIKATLLTSCAEPVQDFYGNVHAMVAINGGARENWPRTGLEAMASGVPVIAQGQWGWNEMIEHGVTGMLAAEKNEYHELAECIATLADNEVLRQEIIQHAREMVVDELANPAKIWEDWKVMLESLGA